MMMTPGEGDNRLMGGREVGNAAVYIYAWDGMVYICLLELASGEGKSGEVWGFLVL